MWQLLFATNDWWWNLLSNTDALVTRCLSKTEFFSNTTSRKHPFSFFLSSQALSNIIILKLGRKKEIWEQTQFSRNEDVELGKKEDQVGPHQKWRHQEGGARKNYWNFPGKQKTKVVCPLLEARTQPHLCEIAKTETFLWKGAEVDRKRDGGTT